MKKSFAMLLTTVLALSVAGSAMAKHRHHQGKKAKNTATETTKPEATKPAKK